MISASLCEGCLPASQNHVTISPLLDSGEMKDCQPVSNLTFVCKFFTQSSQTKSHDISVHMTCYLVFLSQSTS